MTPGNRTELRSDPAAVITHRLGRARSCLECRRGRGLPFTGAQASAPRPSSCMGGGMWWKLSAVGLHERARDGKERYPRNRNAMRPRTFLFRFSVPLLLVLVALTQQVLVRTANISPWKAGGFGMFATVDDPAQRSVRAWVVGPEGELPLELGSVLQKGSSLHSVLRRAKYRPTEGSLSSAARALVSVEWSVAGGQVDRWLEPAAAPGAGSDLRDFGAAIRIEVLSRRMEDPRTVVLERRGVAEISL